MQPSYLHQRLAADLAKREASGSRRELTLPTAGLVDFSSNDYLGLSRHLAVRQAQRAAAAGSTGSRLLTGNSAPAQELETRVASFHRAEAALLFNTGYTANLGFFATIPRRGDTVLYDADSHASVKEGIRAGQAKAWSFRHHDLADLERKLMRTTGVVFVAVEALYSMGGDQAPLPALAAFCQRHGLHLIVDEAHSTGVYGPQGEGLVVELGLENAVFARIITFGKALGSQGAAIIGAAVLRDYLVNFCRAFIYTTALPPLTIAGLAAAYDLLPALAEERAKLLDLSDYLKGQLNSVPGLYVPADSHVIHPVFFTNPVGPEPIRRLAAAVRAAGFDGRPIVAPTVPAGTERLRLIAHAFNTRAQIDGLAEALARSAPSLCGAGRPGNAAFYEN